MASLPRASIRSGSSRPRKRLPSAARTRGSRRRGARAETGSRRRRSGPRGKRSSPTRNRRRRRRDTRMKLQDRVAVVTGTSPNIGGGIAEGLAAEGARVACVDLDRSNAEDCAAAIRAAGHRALAVVADVTDEAAVEDAVRQVADELGPVDVLVN